MNSTTERMLPLYEAKMIHQFDHRWATYDNSEVRTLTPAERLDATFRVLPRYWVAQREVEKSLEKDWVLGFRDIARATDERTTIVSCFPRSAVGNKLPVLKSEIQDTWILETILNSFVQDFVSRNKVGGASLNFFLVKQFPVLAPVVFQQSTKWLDGILKVGDWLKPRVLELSHVTYDGVHMGLGETNAVGPFVWDDARRLEIRSEIDGAFFHLYGIPRDDVEYIMETFSIVASKDRATFGEYRTKRLILEAFDAMQEAIDTGVPFKSTLNPPPGKGARYPENEELQ